ncbi:MAG TPA: hypothetical protein VM009_01575 [Terriglobales bacterium]|nr:hypothetical protein [Terriglobales bacterium]
MTMFFIEFIAAIVVLVVFFYGLRKYKRQLRSMEDFRARWKKVDIEAFANVIDPSEERFLRESLPPKDFRRLQRERLRVAGEYLSRVGQNAQLMVQAGQIIEHHNSGVEAERARAHVRDAMRLRSLVFRAQCSLAVQKAFPVSNPALEQALRLYGHAAHSFDNALDPEVATATM